MCRAAETAGLDAIGVSDHCNVSTRDRRIRAKKALGFNLDVTYERRRAAIEDMRERFDLAVYDAVEMDYDSRDVDEIETFLDEAGFDYAVGSVHHLDGVNVHVQPYFERKSEDERRELVEHFYEEVVALFDAGLFEIAAHVDLVERTPALRGFATADHYHRVAAAAEASPTLVELNAGRALDEYGQFHPHPDFLDVLTEYDVEFVLGSDSHTPDELTARTPELDAFVAEHDIEPVSLEI